MPQIIVWLLQPIFVVISITCVCHHNTDRINPIWCSMAQRLDKSWTTSVRDINLGMSVRTLTYSIMACRYIVEVNLFLTARWVATHRHHLLWFKIYVKCNKFSTSINTYTHEYLAFSYTTSELCNTVVNSIEFTLHILKLGTINSSLGRHEWEENASKLFLYITT